VQALFAESLMDLHPWSLWSANGKPGPETLELVATLERTLKKHPNHLGANHYYIHAVEASPHPERALPSARRLASLAPEQGHLVHMPSHIYIRTGMYHDAARANEAAIKTDQDFLTKSHETGVYPVMYATHNYDFLLYSEMMEGRKRDAIKTARELKDMVPVEVVKAMPMGEVMWPKPSPWRASARGMKSSPNRRRPRSSPTPLRCGITRVGWRSPLWVNRTKRKRNAMRLARPQHTCRPT
jgi:hypothetical protein